MTTLDHSAVGSEVAIRLARTFDASRLQSDLDALMHLPRAAQPGPYHDGNWTGINLYSQPDQNSTKSSGSAGLRNFEPDAVLGLTPYFREILDGLDCHKQTVRLLALPAGAAIGEHNDAGTNFETGVLRLHIPIVTHPDVIMSIGGQVVRWRAGEFWWGDFAQPHWIKNQSPVLRVHMVIDVEINEFVLGLFPADFVERKRAQGAGISLRQPRLPSTAAELAAFACTFQIPGQAMPLFGAGRKLTDLARGAQARLEVRYGELVGMLDGEPAFRLERIGAQAFGIVGHPPGVYLEFEARNGLVSGLDLVLKGLPTDLFAAQLGIQDGPSIPVQRVELPLDRA